MKTKLTLSIDAEVANAAKIISAKKKQSVSSLVEEYLRTINQTQVTGRKKTELSFTQKFRKKFSPPSIEYTDKQIKKLKDDHIIRKYGS